MGISKYNKSELSNLDRTIKINLINSITGLKLANLIGITSKNADGALYCSARCKK